jgi:hypothetical protein
LPRLATLFLVGGLALRAVWLAWQYYFAGGSRYRVESAMIALVIIGTIAVALRRRALARSSCRHRYARCTPSLNLLLHSVNAYLLAALGQAMGMRREVAQAGCTFTWVDGRFSRSR